MTIKRVEVFETKGKQFPTIAKAVEYRENLVEEFLRKTPGFQDIPGSQRIAFVAHILENRAALTDLLDYSNKVAEEWE